MTINNQIGDEVSANRPANKRKKAGVNIRLFVVSFADAVAQYLDELHDPQDQREIMAKFGMYRGVSQYQ